MEVLAETEDNLNTIAEHDSKATLKDKASSKKYVPFSDEKMLRHRYEEEAQCTSNSSMSCGCSFCRIFSGSVSGKDGSHLNDNTNKGRDKGAEKEPDHQSDLTVDMDKVSEFPVNSQSDVSKVSGSPADPSADNHKAVDPSASEDKSGAELKEKRQDQKCRKLSHSSSS
eukprot:1663626-Ditylum_brightwellii.AAC.1